MREEMVKDADYAKTKFEKIEADLQYFGAKHDNDELASFVSRKKLVILIITKIG